VRKWKAPVLYTAMGVIIGSSFMAASPAMASDLNFKTFVASLVQNGQTVSKPSAIAYNGTSYFGIWWLQQQLKKDGIQVQWDGKSLTLTGMPVQSTSTLSAQGTSGTNTVFANSINVNGTTYVPLSEVQALLQASGSRVQLHEGGDSSEGQNNSFKGVINQLKNINEKLTEFQNAQLHGQGDSMGEAFSSFAGSLTKLQSVINELKQMPQPSWTSGSTGATGGTSTGTSTGTSSGTSTGSSSTSGSTSTGGSTSTSGSTSTGGSVSTGSSTSVTPTVALSAVIASLQTDWNTLNAYALQVAASASGSASGSSSTGTTTGNSSTGSTSTGGTSTGSTSGSTSTGTTTPGTDVSAVIADINTQMQNLTVMEQMMQSPWSQGGSSHHDN
jgi:hypothetical protein